MILYWKFHIYKYYWLFVFLVQERRVLGPVQGFGAASTVAAASSAQRTAGSIQWELDNRLENKIDFQLKNGFCSKLASKYIADIHWKPTGPGAEKDRLFLIQLVSEVPNRQISQIVRKLISIMNS